MNPGPTHGDVLNKSISILHHNIRNLRNNIQDIANIVDELIQILSFRRIVTVFVPLHPVNSSHAISTVGCFEIIDSQSVLEIRYLNKG
jgi:hypothetical protein